MLRSTRVGRKVLEPYPVDKLYRSSKEHWHHFNFIADPNPSKIKEEALKELREIAAVKIGSIARGRCGRRRADKLRKERDAAITIQRVARGYAYRRQIQEFSEGSESTEDVPMTVSIIKIGSPRTALYNKSYFWRTRAFKHET